MVKNLFLFTVFLAICIPAIQDYYSLNIFFGISVRPFEIALILTLIFYGIKHFSSMKIPLRSPLSVPIAFFLAVSVSWTIWGAMHYGMRVALYDVRFVLYYVLYFVGLSVIKTQKDVNSLLKVSIAGVFIYSIIVLVEHHIRSGPMWSSRPEYLQDTNRLGANNGLMAILLLPFSIFLYSSKALRKRWNIWATLLITALMIVLFFSQSRVAILMVLFIVLASLVILIKNDRISSSLRLMVFIVALSFVSFLFISEEFLSRLYALRNITLDSSFMTRYLTAAKAIEEITRSPMLGYGFGSLMIETSRETQGTVLDLTNYFIDWTWITLVFKVGIIGGALFTWLWLRSFRVIRAIRPVDEWLWIMRKASLVTFVVIIAISVPNAFLIKGQIIIFLAAFLAMIERLRRISVLLNRR